MSISLVWDETINNTNLTKMVIEKLINHHVEVENFELFDVDIRHNVDTRMKTSITVDVHRTDEITYLVYPVFAFETLTNIAPLKITLN